MKASFTKDEDTEKINLGTDNAPKEVYIPEGHGGGI